MDPTLRRLGGIGLAFLLALGVTSCGTTAGDNDTEGGNSEDGTFPVEIDSALGTAEIPEIGRAHV